MLYIIEKQKKPQTCRTGLGAFAIPVASTSHSVFLGARPWGGWSRALYPRPDVSQVQPRIPAPGCVDVAKLKSGVVQLPAGCNPPNSWTYQNKGRTLCCQNNS